MEKILINIKADKEVKEKARKIAEELGLSLSAIVNAYLKQFIRTKEVHFYVEGKLKPAVKRRLDRPQKDVEGGRNLSGSFSTSEEMDAYLNSLK